MRVLRVIRENELKKYMRTDDKRYNSVAEWFYFNSILDFRETYARESR